MKNTNDMIGTQLDTLADLLDWDINQYEKVSKKIGNLYEAVDQVYKTLGCNNPAMTALQHELTTLNTECLLVRAMRQELRAIRATDPRVPRHLRDGLHPGAGCRLEAEVVHEGVRLSGTRTDLGRSVPTRQQRGMVNYERNSRHRGIVDRQQLRSP